MKNIKICLFFAICILLLLGGIGYVYQMPILVQQDCKSVALYRYHFGGEDGPSLNDTIDLASFKQLNPSNLYKDKRHVYRYFSMLDGGSFSILEGADASSFELLGDCYAKDKHHIYEERFGKLEDADYASFKTKSDAGCVAQDKNGYWFWNDRKAWKDMNSEEKERAKALQ